MFKKVDITTSIDKNKLIEHLKELYLKELFNCKFNHPLEVWSSKDDYNEIISGIKRKLSADEANDFVISVKGTTHGIFRFYDQTALMKYITSNQRKDVKTF